MAALIIASNVIGPLPIYATFQAPMDGPTSFLFSATAWSSAQNVMIGVQVVLDGNVVGTTQLFSNFAGDHKALPTLLFNVDLQPGQHKVVFVPINANTLTDLNDTFSLSLLM